MNKYLITPTLLNSFDYYYKDDGENQEKSRQDFLRTLSREKSIPNEAMQRGIDWENTIFQYTTSGVTEHKSTDLIKEIGDIVKGGIWQYSCKSDIKVCDKDFLLYGKCDVINFDTIYDIKYTSSYDIGKYQNSAQHLIYLYCLGNLPKFSYLISDGKSFWREDYFNNYNIENEIKSKISDFISYLERDKEASDLFCSKWITF
jgi:hypothetical protein